MDLTILLIALSLAIDCFAVSICVSSSKRENFSSLLRLPLFFGIFQAAMAVIGYYLGTSFQFYIESFDHWVAFLLLAGVGIKTIKESNDTTCENLPRLSLKRIIILSIATSIDSLVIGLALSMMAGGILFNSMIIGAVAALLSLVGIYLGGKIKFFKIKFIGFLGGLVLIAIGIKILALHMF